MSAILLREISAEGKTPAYLKPVLTGGSGEDSDSDPSRCRVLSGVKNLRVEWLLAFPEALDPMTAAFRSGVTIDPAVLREAVRRLGESHALVVEGAGGVLSPFFANGSGILNAFERRDLDRSRIHLVSHPHLGCLSQILSAVRVLEPLEVHCLHLVCRPVPDPWPLATSLNPDTLRRLLPDIPVRVHLPELT